MAGSGDWHDRDSEGEEQGVIRPSLIRELKNILCEYPDDGQILQEMIQNAEDAGASTVKILAETRHFNQHFDQETYHNRPHLKYLKGPALCVYNDEVFSDKDWEGIRMLHLSIKEKDPLKVGRFGLGFKSVFHLTDRVVIMSGDYILYMDPFKNETRYCTRKRIAGRHGKELESLMYCFGGSLFGVTNTTFQAGTGRFPGTLFWFPLRQSPGELSSTVYTDQCCLNLLNMFKKGASPMLLFLNNVESIELFSKDQELGIKKLFTVTLEDGCLQDARARRRTFRGGIPVDGSLPNYAVHSETVLTVEMKDHVSRSAAPQKESWMVVNYYPGDRELTRQEKALCIDPELSYRPFVGVAIPASGHQDFQSRVFCTLPLPLDTRSITGLPVHVNGFFALSQNRRHLKWPDQLRHRAQLEPSLQWNLFLVTVLLPRAYAQLLESLKQFSRQNPFVVYTAWPDVSVVNDRWKPLAEQLYKDMVTKPSFFTPANQGQWIQLRQAILVHFPKEVGKEMGEAVVKVYSLSDQNLLQLPEHVQKGLEEYNLLSNASTVNAKQTSKLLPGCLDCLTDLDKLHLLEYLCTQGSASDLVGHHLLPLHDGRFGKFEGRGSGSPVTYWCEEKLMGLFPGLEGSFCSTKLSDSLREHLRSMAERGSLSLSILQANDPAVPSLLGKSLQRRFGSQPPTVPLDDVWLQHIWQFLSSTAPWSANLNSFLRLPLLPCVEGDHLRLLPLQGIYLCSSVQGLPPLPEALASGLRRLGVTILPQLPYCVLQHREVLGSLVLYPSMDGVLTALGKVNADPSLSSTAVNSFNSSATQGERDMLLNVIVDMSYKNEKAGKLLRQLKLFVQPGSGQAVSVEQVDRIAPESLPPLKPPMPLLFCNPHARSAALKLGAVEVTEAEVVSAMLDLMKSDKNIFSPTDRNTFMTYFLDNRSLVDNASLLQKAKQVKFVLTASGQMRMANELYRPSDILQELFTREDKFPAEEICKSELLGKLKLLGLRDEAEVSSADLIQSAQLIENFQKSGDRQTAGRKAGGLWKLLVKRGETVLNNDATVLPRLASVQCLPCLQKDEMPDNYSSCLPLAGSLDSPQTSPVFARPEDMCDFSLLHLIGSVMPVARQGLAKRVADALKIGSKMRLDAVLQHLNNMIQVFKQQSSSSQQQNEIVRSTLSVCASIYQYLTERLISGSGKQAAKELSDRLANTDVVWTDVGFVPPRRVAFRCSYDCRPYLFQLEGGLHQYKPLFQAIGVKETFGMDMGLWVLQTIHDEHSGRPLPPDLIGLVNRAAQLLCEAVKVERGSLVRSRVYLPDCNAIMQHTDQLCFGDSPWLSELENVRFVHDSISVDTARALGVKTRKRKVYDELVKAIPFGQKEKLTDRIKGLLKGYTIDSSLFKELLQNADDAGATEIKFIKNFRQFGVERIPEGWERLQGPALCVYNNRSFTSRDMEGIHNLGRGSKGSDLLKTGQYGVGFNAVYHITDTPSFWTTEDDKNEVICVFDPSCQYLPDINPYEPGVKFEDVEGLKLAYPDLFAAYIKSGVNMNQPGTLFRFPLRTEEMAMTSDIKSDPVTVESITQLLEVFKEEMGMCLLFLNNIDCIGIYTATDTGELALEYAAQKVFDEQNSQKRIKYKRQLQEMNRLVESDMEVADIPESETILQLKLAKTAGHIEDWLIVNKVGFTAKKRLPKKMQAEWKEENFRLMPRGGVAVQLSRYTHDNQPLPYSVEDRHAFCMLPLPVRTGLPMHVNGHFALDHETRRSLWDNKEDARTQWNRALVLQVVVPAYLRAAQCARQLWFPDRSGLDSGTFHQLSIYHQLFPALGMTVAQVWRSAAEEIYRQLALQELPLFPMVRTDLGTMEWVPVVKKRGQQGLFCNTYKYLKGVAGDSDQTRKKATDFQAVLKALNMKVLDNTPFEIMENFTRSGVEEVGEMSPEAVTQFLKTGRSGDYDGCNIGNLPCHVENTPFQSAVNVQTCLLFLGCGPEIMDNLDGLPLCLRQSGNLYYFQYLPDSQKPVVSSFVSTLPGSADLFLHGLITDLFLPVTDKTQPMMQELNIPMLAQMLPSLIPAEQYRTGQPCVLTPGLKWLRGIWKFLETQLQSLKGEEGIANRQGIEAEMGCLSEWSLIPVKIRMGNTAGQVVPHPGNDSAQVRSGQSRQKAEQLLLYPVRDMHRVVHLPNERDQCFPQLWDVLHNLHSLPLLNLKELPRSSAVTKIVASISHPAALLRALTSCGQGLTTSPPHARAVLSYFSSCLPQLEELIPGKKDLCAKLRKLPFFTTIYNSIISVPPDAHVLCLAHNIPHEGLPQWSAASNSSPVLLPCSTVPDNLAAFLGFRTPTPVQFYCEFLLPGIAALPRAAILPHMDFLRGLLHRLPGQEKEPLCKQLRATPFLHIDGQLYRAQNFYSPLEPVFQHMCPDYFPPSPYCTEDWHGFMRTAGLINQVTEDMFAQFARKVESDAQKEITPALVAKSHALAGHLLQRKNLTSTNLLRQVRDIRFLCPSEWVNSPDGQFLTQIVPPFSPLRLVSFDESCSERHVVQTWSSSWVLNKAADPTESSNKDDAQWLKEVLNQIGWQKCAPRDKVIQHAKNVCSALTGKEGEEKFQLLGVSQDTLNLLLMVMSKLYEYLDKYVDEEQLAGLKQLHIICDAGRCRMLKSQDVVMDLREEEAIEGHIYKAPNELGRFFSLFQKLGVAQVVTADHYARVLHQLAQQAKGECLHVEEMKIVKRAVEGLFRCLKSKNTDQKSLTAKVLFLPSEHPRLVESSKLVFKDDESLGERFKKLQTDDAFFLGFKKLDIQVSRPEDEVRLLPKAHQMVWLTSIVQEMVPQAVKERAVEGAEARDLADNLTRPDCTAAVVRLAYHQHKHSDKPKTTAFTEDTAQQIMQKLTYITVKEVAGLKTVLLRRGQQVAGSEFKRASFMETSEEGARACTLYLDTMERQLTGQKFTSSLAHAVQFVLRFDSVYAVHLQFIFENPAQAASHLDSHNIERFNVGNIEDDSIFPPPGTLIPVHLHCYLDSNICQFYSGEHVGFEVYDPLVDADGFDTGEPVYIYAKVLREVTRDFQGSSSHLFRRYLVDLGPERGKVEVHATQLYKFIRKDSSSRPSSGRAGRRAAPNVETITDRARQLTVRSETQGGSAGRPSAPGGASPGASSAGAKPQAGAGRTAGAGSTTPEEEKESKPQDMDAVLKEIRQILTDAWKLPDEKDRMRAVKRLLLKWHPDKNRGNEEFCTKVTQIIQQYVQKLKNGGHLSDDDKKNTRGNQRNDDRSGYGNSSSAGRGRGRGREKGTSSGEGARGPGFGTSGSRSHSGSFNDDFFSSFFENMFRRQRESEQRSSGREYPSSGRGDAGWRDSTSYGFGSFGSSDWRSTKNPQPGEAQRWFRQAEADMKTAQTLSAGGPGSYNWVCYLCYQAAQKALTAVLYYRDANQVPGTGADIMQLAGRVDDSTLTDLVRQLEACVVSTKRMRYPGMFSYPHIPSEVYSENDARMAFETAAKLLERVKGLQR